MTNSIANIAKSLTGSPFTAGKKAPTLAQCKAEMAKQIAATQKGIASTFQAAVALGEAATIAQGLCEKGTWLKWLQENFATKYTWVNVCMRAAAAWHLLEKRPEAERDAVLLKFDTVEKFAGTLTVLDQGESPLVKEPVKRARAPNKLKIEKDAIDVESRDIPDTGAGANEAADIIKALDARSLALDKREEALAKRKDGLDAQARKLVLWEADLKGREAALKGARKAPKAEPMGLKPDESVEALKAKALAQSEKATRKPAPAAATAPKPKAKATPAPAEKTPEKRVRASAPGKAALLQAEKDAIKARAQAAAAAPVPNEPVNLPNGATDAAANPEGPF